MEPKSAAKVGSVVLLALALFGGLYLYLSHLNPNAYLVRVTFKNTKGLGKQSLVRMRGVTIGEVQNVDLDKNRIPIATLAIDKRYTIPTDYKFVIVSGILITNPQVEVVPPEKETQAASGVLPQDGTATARGGDTTSALAAFSPELADTVKKLNATFDDLRGKFGQAYVKLDRILDRTTALMETGHATLKSAQSLIGDPRLKNDLLAAADNLTAITSDARKTSKNLSNELRSLIASGRGKFDKMFETALDLAAKIGDTIQEVNTVVAKFTEQVTDPRLQNSLQETAELARTTLARFNQIASDIHQLTGDPQLQNDLKVTVEKLRVATESGQQIVDKVNTLLGNVVGSGGKVPTPRFPRVQLVSNISEQFSPSRLRVDVDARVPISSRSLLDFGFYDLGQETRLNLLYGTQLTDKVTSFYGLYASRLGARLEWQASPSTAFQADLWDTSRPRLDVKGLFRVNSDASIWIGADGLLRRPIPLIGFQLKH